MVETKSFWRKFSLRGAVSLFLIMVLFLYGILRVTVIALTDYSAVLENQNFIKLKIGDLRGTVFDCNMIPITNNSKRIIAAVLPTERAKTALKNTLEGEKLDEVLLTLEKGKPILCEVPEFINCDGIVCTENYKTEDDIPAIHTIGYTDNENSGVTGLQKAYDSYLKSDSESYVLYECNGKGELLLGAEPIVRNNTSVIAGGIVSTIDINIQNIAELATKELKYGAVVVTEAENSKIRAIVSRPDFNISDIENCLTREDSPLLNRAISAYNVGSVFKPCVAIAGIEKGIKDLKFNCSGSTEIIDRFFKCHKIEGHGLVDLKESLAFSCNTFFYNYAFKIGAGEILKKASELQFGRALNLCENIKTAKGNLPKVEKITNNAQLANLSIGQGELLLSPISITTLYTAIATDGKYYIPSLIEGILENGKLKEYDIGKPTRVMEKSTADILKEYLVSVVEEGTGVDAKPQHTTAAGKTATAQTGKFVDGLEINAGWFCGFFPREKPKYVVSVFSEDTKTQEKTCAQIFAEIADNVSVLKNFN